MEDAFASSDRLHGPSPLRRLLGWALYGLAVLVAWYALTVLIYDVLMLAIADSSPSDVAGLLFVQPVRLGVLGLLGIAALGGAQQLLWPDRYGRDVHARAVLQRVYEDYGLAAVRDLRAGEDFAALQAHDLADVYGNLDRHTHPDRFRALLGAIKQAVEEARKG